MPGRFVFTLLVAVLGLLLVGWPSTRETHARATGPAIGVAIRMAVEARRVERESVIDGAVAPDPGAPNDMDDDDDANGPPVLRPSEALVRVSFAQDAARLRPERDGPRDEFRWFALRPPTAMLAAFA